MTREEAREALSVLKIYDAQWLREAVDMAIEALSADAVEVVRCKVCKWWQDNLGCYSVSYCPWNEDIGLPDADDFCSYGERREK